MLARLFGRQPEERSAPFVVSGQWGWGVVAGTRDYDALLNDAVWACVRVLGSSVANMPFGVVREQGTARLPVTPTPSLVARPSGLVTVDVWLFQLVWSFFADGNAWGKITSVDGAQRPTSIETLHPAHVTERKVERGVVQAKVDGEVMRAYPHGDLWHLPGVMVPAGSPFGLSPVEYARKAIRASLAAQDFGAGFFTDGGTPSAIIYSDQKLTDPQAQAIKQRFIEATRGSREPAVFGSGLKYERVSVAPGESQFIDIQRFVVEQVCRFLGVPPSMVYAAISGQNVTYANVSQADLHYLKHNLETPLVRIETGISALLPRPQIARFNRNAFLRADPETRNKIYDMRLKNKTTSVNAVRALEDEEPFADPIYDEPGIPAVSPTDEPTGGQP